MEKKNVRNHCCCASHGIVVKPSHSPSISPSEYASPSSRTYAPTVGRMQAPWFRLRCGARVRHFLRTRDTLQVHTYQAREKKGRREKEKRVKSLPRSNNGGCRVVLIKNKVERRIHSNQRPSLPTSLCNSEAGTSALLHGPEWLGLCAYGQAWSRPLKR